MGFDHCSDMLFLLVIVILSLMDRCHCEVNYREMEKKILDNILFSGSGKNSSGYDKRIRPAGINDLDGPTIVNINLMIRSIARIDDVTMEYSVQLIFREQWTDKRLEFDDMNGRFMYLTLTDPRRIWMPDLFFKNERTGHLHAITMPNMYIRIFSDGGVLYSVRISLTLACPMDLRLYPLDKQICSLKMASYAWKTDDLIFVWKKGDPVQIDENLHLPRFTLEKFQTAYCNSKTNTGEYSCLTVDLQFKREFSYYLIQIYVPCCMLVIVSWVSFWLDQNAVPARVSLGVTTLLTMATQTSGINASLPPVSYTKAIDVWTGVCLMFVFGAMLEFALVNYASRSDMQLDKSHMARRHSTKDQEMIEDVMQAAELSEDSNAGFHMNPMLFPNDVHLLDQKAGTCEVHLQSAKPEKCCKNWLAKFPTRSKRIDVIARIIFPLVFAFFNLAYWSTYIFTDDEQ